MGQHRQNHKAVTRITAGFATQPYLLSEAGGLPEAGLRRFASTKRPANVNTIPSESGHVTGSENTITPAMAAIATCEALMRFTATTGNAFNETDNATKALKFNAPAAAIIDH